MKLGFSVEIKQSQKLHLTKELQQSIEILQMTSQEVENVIAEELNSNPVLESSSNINIDWSKYVNDIKDSIKRKEYRGNEYTDRDINPENFVKNEMSLYEYLENELIYMNFSEEEKKIAYLIIEFVNESGYYIGSSENIAKEVKCKASNVEKVLTKLQKIESSGMFARNLRECIILQIDDTLEYADKIKQIVLNSLEEIAQKKYSQLQKKYKLSKDELNSILKTIKSIDPKPGKKFSNFRPIYVLPDVIVERNGNSLEILDSSNFPNLYISDFYRELLSETDDDEAKQYIKEKLNKATGLIKNINQRKMTINKVAKSIVELQSGFFSNRKEKIIPMKLKDIADMTGFHESTISRSINGKYMLTPWGFFEFKYFFSNAINTAKGEISSSEIKNRIKIIILEENKKKPYSDSSIAKILENEGLSISRRTVAKYREELEIPSSTLRKEI